VSLRQINAKTLFSRRLRRPVETRTALRHFNTPFVGLECKPEIGQPPPTNPD
jgi:hypothetical protein